VRIHAGSADVVAELIQYFERQSDCVVRKVSTTELDVSLLGSYRSDRHDAAVERLLAQYWLGAGAANPNNGARHN
jgi:hypothetical protein